jgi:hypothetical protein
VPFQPSGSSRRSTLQVESASRYGSSASHLDAAKCAPTLPATCPVSEETRLAVRFAGAACWPALVFKASEEAHQTLAGSPAAALTHRCPSSFRGTWNSPGRRRCLDFLCSPGSPERELALQGPSRQALPRTTCLCHLQADGADGNPKAFGVRLVPPAFPVLRGGPVRPESPPTGRCSLEIAPHLRGSALLFRLPIDYPRAAKQRLPAGCSPTRQPFQLFAPSPSALRIRGLPLAEASVELLFQSASRSGSKGLLGCFRPWNPGPAPPRLRREG